MATIFGGSRLANLREKKSLNEDTNYKSIPFSIQKKNPLNWNSSRTRTRKPPTNHPSHSPITTAPTHASSKAG